MHESGLYRVSTRQAEYRIVYLNYKLRKITSNALSPLFLFLSLSLSLSLSPSLQKRHLLYFVVFKLVFLLFMPPLPNQQHTLNKLPPQLQCRNVVKVTKHQLSLQIGAKSANAHILYIFQLTLHFAYYRWWLGMCIVYRLVYRDTFAVSTRVSTRQEILDIAQP